METTLTDQEKTEAWIDLAIYNGWIESRLPEEAIEAADIHFNECGSSILQHLVKIQDRTYIVDLIKNSNDSQLALLTLSLINGSFTFGDDKLRSLHFFWYAIVQEYKKRHDFEMPERILPKFYVNDVYNIMDEIKQEYIELSR